MESVPEPEQGIQPSLTGMMQYWQNLHTQAESGSLRMDEALGTALRNQVTQLITQLEGKIDAASDLQYVGGFGGLDSAKTLQQKFMNKAVGDEDSAVSRLKQAIDIAKLMEKTYALAIGQLETTDQSTATALGNMGDR